MGIRKRITGPKVEVITTRGPRSSDTADLSEQFPGTPGDNSYDLEAALAIFQNCLDGVQNDNVEFEGGVNMDYGDAPTISADVSAATLDGSAASPYLPNPQVPPTGNPNDFVFWDGIDAWAAAQKVEQFPIGTGGTSSELDPSTSASAISSVKIEDIPGSSGPTETI